MSRSLILPTDVDAYPSEESKKKAAADVEIAKKQMDLIASGPLRIAWQRSQKSQLR